MINILDKKRCVGCGACRDLCPNSAISFIYDNSGFIYPVVEKTKCINCNLCDKVCPILNSSLSNKKNPVCKMACNKDENIRKLSTSGGVFSALAKCVIADGGYVCGVEISDNFRVQHNITNSVDSADVFYRAKYVQSSTGDSFVKIKALLDTGNRVLFSGTPCQVAGLKSFLRSEHENLITVEVICHGVVSQKVFDRYLLSLKNRYKSDICSYEFRNKDISWQRYTSKANFVNGDVYQKERNDDPYMVGYLKYNLYLRPSCTDCQFKGFPRAADITLGDFWGIEEHKQTGTERGISAVLLNSEKGIKLFDKIKSEINQEDVLLDNILKGNHSLIESTCLGKYSDYFYKHFEKKDFIDLINKIEKKAVWDRKDLSLKDRAYLIKERIKGN